MFKFLIRKQRGIFRIYLGLRWSTRKDKSAPLSRAEYQALNSTAYALLFTGEHDTAPAAQQEVCRLQGFMCEQGHSFKRPPSSKLRFRSVF